MKSRLFIYLSGHIFTAPLSQLVMKAKISLIVSIAIFMATAVKATTADDLNLSVTIITGEHSRDLEFHNDKLDVVDGHSALRAVVSRDSFGTSRTSEETVPIDEC